MYVWYTKTPIIYKGRGKHYKQIEVKDHKAFKMLDQIKKDIARINRDLERFFESYG